VLREDRGVARRRVSLRESLRKATDGDARDDSGGLAMFAIGFWYWIAGEPIRDGDEAADDPT
jgi:hypothetical protein